jgi:hypothetical protein
MREDSAHRGLQTGIRADQLRIASGERPLYHVVWTLVPEGADVTIRELPLIHLFVSDHLGVPEGARGLIAGKLSVHAASFDLVTEDQHSN